MPVTAGTHEQQLKIEDNSKPTVESERRRRRAWLLLVGALVLALVTALIFAAPYSSHAPLDASQARYELSVPGIVPGLGSLSISPDGQRVAYTAAVEGDRAVWIRRLGGVTAQQLPGTENAVGLFWSPDSRYLGFIADGKLKKIDLSGGPAQALCDASIVPAPGAWSRSGAILFTARGKSNGSVIGRISALGGEVRLVTALDASRKEVFHAAPQFLPDGHHFLYHSLNASQGVTLYLGSLESKSAKQLMTIGSLATSSPAIYVAPGYVLFRRNRTLMAQAFDQQLMALAGDPILLAENVASVFSGSENGVLVYRNRSSQQDEPWGSSPLVWFDRHGQPASQVTAPASITAVVNWLAGLKK
ncbi:MAG: hypothetical protein DMG13_22360 [Acidobacteria bacterium]|nr:MAG: hypothetical protein DMG13_22360 [Acidobacteriota bacterium]